MRTEAGHFKRCSLCGGYVDMREDGFVIGLPIRQTIQTDGDGTMTTETETQAPKFDELEIAELEGVSGGRPGVVNGGANRNAALGCSSNASQQIFIGGQ
jgi:hypothetical protein